MKKISIYLSATVIAGGLLASCSSNYLDVEPITDISETQLSDPSAAKSLMDGIWLAMNTQYGSLSWNQNCGEAQIHMTLGEGAGADMVSNLYGNILPVWSQMPNPNGYPTAYAWDYYYNIINLSNFLINSVDATSEDTKGADNQLLFYKAQALTMRAHAYAGLLIYYGQRWEDSDNGEAYCVVMRTKPGTEATPLVKMNEVLDLIYSDLDEAVKLYDMSGKDRLEPWECNKNVAYGVWARAALLKNDWARAAEMASLARKGKTIMSEKELFAGFFADTSETIWSMDPTPNTTYYWSWGSHYSCNGSYINNWAIGAGAINIDLYNALEPNDLRRKFFWTPDKMASIPKSFNPGKLTDKDFWNPDMVDETNILNMAFTNVYDRTGKDKAGFGMLNALAYFLMDYYENVFTGDRTSIANDDNQFNSFMLAYVQKDTKKQVRMAADANGNARYVTCLTTPFGVQNKFWSIQPYGNMAYPWMRASEMALAEAEAYYRLGDEGKARAALNEVQTKRIPGYTSSKTGADLWTEIMTCRRIEMWGEGVSFGDLKRWNIERVTRKWVANDPTSGNYAPTMADLANFDEAAMKLRQSPKYCNGWRFSIPTAETRYNKLIDESLLKTIPNE